MRYLLLSIPIVCAVVLSTTAQTPAPSPTTDKYTLVIYAAPTTTEIQAFTAPDKSFTVRFPGTPEVEEKMMGNGKVSSFRVYRTGSNSVIGITDFMRDISANSEQVFKRVRERQLGKADAKLVSEKDVTLDGYAGKELVVDTPSAHRVSRVFVVGSRIYEIYVDISNWGYLTKDYPAVVASFEKEVSRFFDSFRLAQAKPLR